MTSQVKSACELLCPSAQPDWSNSIAIGVVSGSAHEPRTTNFPNAVPVGEKLLALSEPVNPTEVFRFAAPCICNGCAHFQDQEGSLITKIVQLFPAVVDHLPACPIRPQCRWWKQEGRAACLRCPQVVTDNCNPSDSMRLVSDPEATIQDCLSGTRDTS